MKDPDSYANPINSSFQKFRTTRAETRRVLVEVVSIPLYPFAGMKSLIEIDCRGKQKFLDRLLEFLKQSKSAAMSGTLPDIRDNCCPGRLAVRSARVSASAVPFNSQNTTTRAMTPPAYARRGRRLPSVCLGGRTPRRISHCERSVAISSP